MLQGFFRCDASGAAKLQQSIIEQLHAVRDFFADRFLVFHSPGAKAGQGAFPRWAGSISAEK